MTTVSKVDIGRAARWFHAFSDETRLEIIDRLSAGEQCVCDLTDALQTGQSRLSFHLKTLKDAGILQDRREGRWIYYSLNQETIKEVAEFVQSLRSRGSGSSAASRC
ncbi:MAG: winged helix-turn-helix transcriptional regulator [Nitrospirae bacterium]|nr:winged helix-turn-helix transcriptional regulator [Nitrospirota bacterium]